MDNLIYKILFQNAADAVFVHDLNGKMLDVNQEACLRLGYSYEEMLGLTPLDFDASEYAAEFNDRIKELVKENNIFVEIVHVTKDKRQIPTEINSRVVEINNQKVILTIARDISQRKQMEKLLVENEIKYRIVADNTYDWELWKAPDGKILYCSPSCLRITGYSAQNFIDNQNLIEEIIYSEDKERVRAIKKDNKSCGKGEITFRIVRADGQIIWIGHVCQKVFDGEVCLGCRGSNRDITASVKDKEDLKLLNEQLESKNRSLFEIVHSIEIERNEFKEKIKNNIDKFILPELRKIKDNSNAKNKNSLEKLEENFKNIISNFGVNLLGLGLTDREVEVCKLLKTGLNSAKIGKKLQISYKSVNTHRRNIRKKLQLNKRKINLAAFLSQLNKSE